MVRIDFNFILGIVAGHHGSSNKIINSEIPFTMLSFRFLFPNFNILLEKLIQSYDQMTDI